jgi:hypothetical protein
MKELFFKSIFYIILAVMYIKVKIFKYIPK